MEPPKFPQPPSQPSPKSQTTTSDSLEYIHKLADISSRACLTEPLNILFQHDKHGLSSPILLSNLYTTTLHRISTKTSLGSFVIESSNFAAVACIEPPSSIAPPLTPSFLTELSKTQPIYASFLKQLQQARKECLGERKFWQFSLMARDPERRGKGAVRAIIESLLERARRDGVPVWCAAGNERARGIYEYFGFEVMKVIYSGEERVETWCMVWNCPVE